MSVRTSSQPYKVDGCTFEGFLADGSGQAPAPGILVVHEGRGFTQHARNRATMLAELGYVAYAPDYFGEQARSLDHAYALMRPFADDRGLFHRHGLAALDVLSAEGGADRSRLGAIGFCWGGVAALELACKADLRCVVGFHPGLSLGLLSAASDVRASVLVCVGDRDPHVPMTDIVRFLDEMHDAAVDCQVHIHSGAPHSFTNPEEYAYETGEAHVGYDARPDGRSWLAMRQLLAEKLPV